MPKQPKQITFFLMSIFELSQIRHIMLVEKAVDMYQMVEKGSGVIKNVEIFKIEVELSTHKTGENISQKLNKSRKIRQEQNILVSACD